MISSGQFSYSGERAERFALLEVTPHLYPDKTGGIPLNVDSLATALSNKFDVTVVANWMGPASPPIDRKYSLRVFPTRLVLLGNPISLKLVIWLIKNIKLADVVHAHSHLFVTSVAAIAIAKLTGKPVVLTNHGLISFSQPILLQRAWIRLVSKTILSMCTRIVCFTSEDRDRLVAFGAQSSRIVVERNGVNLVDFQPVTRNYRGTLRIVWLGRMVREKGLEYLLAALTMLKHLEKRIQVTLVGEGPIKAKLREYARSHQLDTIVKFQTSAEYRNVPLILATQHLMILPSLTEGFPRVAIEALATGMPLLCSSLPQLTTSLGDCAIYFSPGDPVGIAAAITWADHNRDSLPEFGERGRELVSGKYAWEETVKEREQLFLLLVKSGRRTDSETLTSRAHSDPLN